MELPSEMEWLRMSEAEKAAFVRGATTAKKAKGAAKAKRLPDITAPISPALPTKVQAKARFHLPARRPAPRPPKPWPAITRRNLLFFIFPLRNPSRVWQWHVRQLRKRLSLFNGEKIVAIATGAELLDSPQKVRQAFGSDAKKIRFIELPNNSRTWEADAMLTMLRAVKSKRRDEASFYFHAKGVRRIEQTAIRPWCEAIYRACLDDHATAMESLKNATACGVGLYRSDPSGERKDAAAWHFSGNGWWVRHDALFGNAGWHQPLASSRHSHNAEAYLATQFDRHEAKELLHVSGYPYDPATWAPAEPWRVSVIVTARNYGRYLYECLESCLWQTNRPHEVIYCDDASQDDSLQVAKQFHGIKILPLKKNLGVVGARNYAAERSTGNALLFVDGDNILPQNYLQAMLAAIDRQTPFVYPDLCFLGSETAYCRQPDWKQFDLWNQNHCDTCCLIRRDAFEFVGGWATGGDHNTWCAMEDYHLFLRLAFLGAAKRANVALGYRKHSESLSAASGRDGNVAILRAAERAIREDVTLWAVKKFGRLPNRAERDEGVIMGTPGKG